MVNYTDSLPLFGLLFWDAKDVAWILSYLKMMLLKTNKQKKQPAISKHND